MVSFATAQGCHYSGKLVVGRAEEGGLGAHCSSPGKVSNGAGGAVQLERSEQARQCPLWRSGKLANE